MPEAALTVRGLEAGYVRGVPILRGVGFDLAAGEILTILGPNGAGKSTLVRTVAGLVARFAGEIRLGGASLADLPPHKVVAAGFAYVPQVANVFADLTVDENLRVGRLPPRAGESAPWTPEAAFELFPPLAAMRERKGGQMSGGEQQMLTIARALMGNPRFLLLDEPSEGLAPVIVEVIAGAIAKLKARGVGLLLSEQNLHFARAVADRAFVLDRGHIRFAGTLAELAFAADRSLMLIGTREGDNRKAAAITLGSANFGFYPMGNGLTRLQTRFLGEPHALDGLKTKIGTAVEGEEAAELGLVTAAYEDFDWDDELRVMLEERTSFSPDAMTGMEANLRFAGPETMETKIFGRLTAWQNWIFQRPNAIGEQGALKVYGTGARAKYDWERV